MCAAVNSHNAAVSACNIYVPRATDKVQYIVLEGTSENCAKAKAELEALLRGTCKTVENVQDEEMPHYQILNVDYSVTSVDGIRCCMTKACFGLVHQTLQQHVVYQSLLHFVQKPINEVLFFPDRNLTESWNFTRFLGYIASAQKSLDVCVFAFTDRCRFLPSC